MASLEGSNDPKTPAAYADDMARFIDAIVQMTRLTHSKKIQWKRVETPSAVRADALAASSKRSGGFGGGAVFTSGVIFSQSYSATYKGYDYLLSQVAVGAPQLTGLVTAGSLKEPRESTVLFYLDLVNDKLERKFRFPSVEAIRGLYNAATRQASMAEVDAAIDSLFEE